MRENQSIIIPLARAIFSGIIISMEILKAFNKSRWNREPDFFEVWYLTFNDTKTRDGYWIRFTLVVPKNIFDSPFLNVWFTAFRSDGVISAISENFKISESDFSEEHIKIGESYLKGDTTSGRISSGNHNISWDLRMSDGGEFLHLPRQIYDIPVLHSYLASPNVSFDISGNINIDGKDIEISGRGTQSHIWGRQMPDNWIWAHSENFENHKGFMELISINTRMGILGDISSTRILIKFDEEEFSFTTIKDIGFKDCSVFPEYLFFATGRKYKIEGKLYCDRNRFIQYNYPSPSRKEVYCTNTETGSCSIVVYKRDSITKPFVYYTVLKNSGFTHYEFGGLRRNEQISVANQPQL